MDVNDNPVPASKGKYWVRPAILAGLVVLIALFPLFLDSPYTLHIFILAFIYIVAAASFRTIAISGQFPLGHAAFMGIGAYISGMASKWLGWSPGVTIPLAALISMGIGMLIGYPYSRLRALYYALGSLFFGVAVVTVISSGGKWTGGYSGLAGIIPLFGTSKVPYYYLFLGICLASLLALYRFEFSRIGMNLKAIDQSYMVASSVGINEGWYRILAVGVGCLFAGLIGATYAHYNQVLSVNSFNLGATLWIVMYVLIGGIQNYYGPIIGAAILVLIPEFFRDLKIYSPYLSAGILVIIVYLMPRGLVALPYTIMTWYAERKREKETS
jgi:branched-chain amino acid transport system permease protein